ncbi:MAG: 2'-deoxycytidine 5'-triphosphate deaminase, partial [Nitrospirota bacterium]|nr:2'-deoxycytidine 5'-triphosphate deaminase [Nitrospirota bacterium]
VGHYAALDFWEPLYRHRQDSLLLEPEEFYILASKERIRVPAGYAAEMVAYDPSIGEFRIHYDGFFDPGCGYGSNDIKGSCAVLEVRSHEVPFLVEDGQVVGRLIYERLLAPSDKVYGVGIGSSYQSQGLAVSKHFKV